MHLDIITPKRTLVAAEVDELTAPGMLGEFGVLPGHVPMVAALKPGVVRYRGAAGAGTVAVGAGIVEVAPGDRIVVLASLGQRAEEVDVAEARRELAETQARLDHWQPAPPTAGDGQGGDGKHADGDVRGAAGDAGEAGGQAGSEDEGARAAVEDQRDWAQARIDAATGGQTVAETTAH